MKQHSVDDSLKNMCKIIENFENFVSGRENPESSGDGKEGVGESTSESLNESME